VIGLSEPNGGSLYIAQWLIGPDGETNRQNGRKLRPTHAERTVYGEGDGTILPCMTGPTSAARGAVLLGASAAAVEIRHVCPERAGASGILAELLAVRPVCTGARAPEVNNAASRVYAGGRLLFRAGALRDRLSSHDRGALRPPG